MRQKRKEVQIYGVLLCLNVPGDIDNLFPDTDVSLANQDTGVVD